MSLGMQMNYRIGSGEYCSLGVFQRDTRLSFKETLFPVGHDTQLCLWDVTEDELKHQPLPNLRVRASMSHHTPTIAALPDVPVVKKRTFLLGTVYRNLGLL